MAKKAYNPKKTGYGKGLKSKARRASYWKKKNYPADKFYSRYYPRTKESKERYGEYYRNANAQQRGFRGTDRMFGRGGFWGDAWNTIKTPFWDFAGGVAKGVGVPDIAVDSARDAIRTAGWGNYRANALINGGSMRATGVPSFGPESDTGAVTVMHRKFVRDIFAPALAADAKDFDSTTIQINPGLEETFPWLSQVAANYDSYHLNQCIFTFKSTVAEFQTTTGVVGDILMAVQYNKHDKPFKDTHRMKEYHGSVCGKSTETILCGVECDPKKTAGDDHKFIRYQGLPDGEDKQDYDKGVLTFATANLPSQLAGHKIGELWVSYNVTLIHPKIVTADASAQRQDICVHTKDATRHAFGIHGESVASLPALEIWSNSVNAFRHQHNSIGCRLANAGKQAITTVPQFNSVNMELIGSKLWGTASVARMCGLEIEFPPEEHGDFEIILRVMSDHDMGASTTSIGWILGAVQAYRAAGSNIEPIEDQLVGVKRGNIATPFTVEYDTMNEGANTLASQLKDGGTSCIDSYVGLETDKSGSSNDDHVVAMMRVHLRVKPVTAGERNICKLFMQCMAIGGDTSPNPRILVGTTVEIKEYNALDDLDLSKGFINRSGLKLEQTTGGKAKEDADADFITSNF